MEVDEGLEAATTVHTCASQSTSAGEQHLPFGSINEVRVLPSFPPITHLWLVSIIYVTSHTLLTFNTQL